MTRVTAITGTTTGAAVAAMTRHVQWPRASKQTHRKAVTPDWITVVCEDGTEVRYSSYADLERNHPKRRSPLEGKVTYARDGKLVEYDSYMEFVITERPAIPTVPGRVPKRRSKPGYGKGSNLRRHLPMILGRQGGLCVLCGQPCKSPSIEHLVPRSDKGSNMIENLAASCRTCNNARGSQKLTEEQAARARAWHWKAVANKVEP